jgi:hypothetical protein
MRSFVVNQSTGCGFGGGRRGPLCILAKAGAQGKIAMVYIRGGVGSHKVVSIAP